jgi:hypothetical protein
MLQPAGEKQKHEAQLGLNRQSRTYGALARLEDQPLILDGGLALIAPFIEETLGAIPYRARVGGPDLLVISHVLSSSKERIAGPHIAVTPVVWVRAFARRRGKNDSPLEREVPKVCRLFAGGDWIRTSSTRAR